MNPPTSARVCPVLLITLLIILLLMPVSSAATFTRITDTPTPDPTLVLLRPVATTTVATTDTTSVAQTGYISIDSTPTGASLSIDDTARGTTPFTSRTLTTGTHSLLLQMSGYQDYATTFVIQPDTMNQETYTMTQVMNVVRGSETTANPISTFVPLATTLVPEIRAPVGISTTATPVPVLSMTPLPTGTQPPARQVAVQPAGGNSLSARLADLGTVTIEPVAIRIGNHTKQPIITTLSPWFATQFNSGQATVGNIPGAFTREILPTSYIEVDKDNVYLNNSHLMSSVEVTNDPVWGDDDTAWISSTATGYETNFRWISIGKGMTAFYQVSRYPFSANATHWQNQYVPGLVESGPANDVYVGSDDFHYFVLDFARIANHDPTDPPIYSGLMHLDTTVPGQGKPMKLAKIPFTGTGIWYKTIRAGPVGIPVPDSLASIPPGVLTESDLGNPNENMILSDPAVHYSHDLNAFIGDLVDTDETYYVRIVPIAKDGTAGVPTLPVTVTVKRPHPCPAQSPGNTVASVIVKPPTAGIASFYMNLFVPDWIHTDQNGALVSRAHFVTVVTPPYCSAQATGNTITDSTNAQFCSMYGGSQPGYHFYADPAESHWYDTVWDIIKGMFSTLTSVVNSVSAAWNQINNLVVQIAAYAVQGLTFGAFDCNSSPVCTGVLHAALSAAESSLGVPPTLPNAADLESMGADYMAKVAADQLGAGGALDAAQGAYSSLPDNAKQAIKNNAGDVGQQMGGAVSTQSGAQMANAAGNWYIPDPLYYSPHPATVIIHVSNPNTQATDPVQLTVTDSQGFFRKAQVMVPSLRPQDGTNIPVVLTEDYTNVYTTGCNADAWTTTNGIPCYWENWNQAAHKAGTDQFVLSIAEKRNGQWISGLTPSSSGTVLSSQNVITYDESGQLCPPYTSTSVLKYPSGWNMQLSGFPQNLDSVMWNAYTFTNGESGRLIGG